MRPQKIIISGAGIGGLTAAIALARAGHQVEVLEQAPALGAIGAGVTLAPNAMRVFGHLGLEQAICKAGVQPERQRVQHWQDGRTLLTLERGARMEAKYGASYVYIHRADLHKILINALDDTRCGKTLEDPGCGKVRLSSTVTGASVSGAGAVAEMAGGDWVAGDIVIAADGVKSPIRNLFDPKPAHFTGHVCWRAVVPVTSDLEDAANFPGVHIGPGRMAVRYPVSQGRELNLVFFARQDGWTEEGWAIPGKRSELQALFGDWEPTVRRHIAAIDEGRLFKWAVFARTPLESWVKNGRIALLGDAAHAMTPFLGQGAGCAIEDAMVLARCIEASEDAPTALARYQAVRKERCAFIQLESNANADRMQGEETDLYGLTKVTNEETLGLFDYDAGAVPI